jgi:hypothetical protein
VLNLSCVKSAYLAQIFELALINVVGISLDLF